MFLFEKKEKCIEKVKMVKEVKKMRRNSLFRPFPTYLFTFSTYFHFFGAFLYFFNRKYVIFGEMRRKNKICEKHEKKSEKNLVQLLAILTDFSVKLSIFN